MAKNIYWSAKNHRNNPLWYKIPPAIDIAVARGSPKHTKNIKFSDSQVRTPNTHSQDGDSLNNCDENFLNDIRSGERWMGAAQYWKKRRKEKKKEWKPMIVLIDFSCAFILTRTTTTCTDTCSGSRIGARKCIAKATRRWRMEIRFLPWIAAENKENEADERILKPYFKQTPLGKRHQQGKEKCLWWTVFFSFYPSSSFFWYNKA